MYKKFNIGNSKILICKPVNSIINKINIVASAYSIAKVNNAELFINWYPENDKDYQMYEIIKNFNDLCKLINYDMSKKLNNFKKINKDELIDFSKYKNIFVESDKILNSPDSMIYFQDFFDKIKFVTKISKLVKNTENYQGLYIKDEIPNNIELKNKKLFVYSENKENYKILEERLGIDNILYHDKIDNIFYKIANAIILSKCNSINKSDDIFSNFINYFRKDKISNRKLSQNVVLKPSKTYKLSKKSFIINPQHGFGNRMRAIASAYSIAKETNRKLIINWIPDCHCDCNFDDIIINIKELEIEVVNKTVKFDNIDAYNYMEIEEGTYKNEYINTNSTKIIYVKSNCILNNEYSWTNFHDFFKKIKYVPQINKLIDSIQIDNYIGMHIRMDAGKEYQNLEADKGTNWTKEEKKLMYKWRTISHIDNFINQINFVLHKNPEQKFYIATDRKENYEKLINIYGKDKIKFLKRNNFDRSLEQLYYTVADIVLLSRCKQFYGSYWSSFSELVTYYQNKNIRKNNIFSNDFKYFTGNKISICYACKNRKDNLMESLKSIIHNEIIDDIVLVDFNSDDTNLYSFLINKIDKKFFNKINFIKVKTITPWILSYAYNIALIYAKNDKIIKSDCDYIYSDEFVNYLNNLNLNNNFYSFDWNDAKTENQKKMNGFFYLSKKQLNNCGYFNQDILFYGYDDDDLKNKLSEKYNYSRLKLQNDNLLRHIVHNNNERLKNSSVNNITDFFGFDISDFNDVNIFILYNKILSEYKKSKTLYYEVSNNFTILENKHKYLEVKLNLNNIKKFNYNFDYLSSKRSICDIKIFEKMCSLTNNTLWLHNFGFKKFVDNFKIKETNHKIIFLYIINSCVNEVKKLDKRYNLVITLYNEKKIDRSLELLYCLTKNMLNPYIKCIHILFEKDNKTNFIYDVLQHLINYNKGWKEKIKIKIIKIRPSFNDCFKYINENIKDDFILANSDIIYNNTLKKIPENLEKKVIVLTRYQKYDDVYRLKFVNDNNKIDKNSIANILSMDSWISKSPINLDVKLNIGSFFSDSFINYKLKLSDYDSINMGDKIQSFHIQEDESVSSKIKKSESDERWNYLYKNILKYKTKDFLCGIDFDGNNIAWNQLKDYKKNLHINNFPIIKL